MGDLYELEASLSSGEAKVLERWHVHTPSGRVLTRVVTTADGAKLRYLHQDALGSVYAVTDKDGASVVKYSYDAWGQQTRVTGSALEDDLSTRGYTDHEMLSDYGLIHMNGRLYDPTVSRFLSADPFVDDAKDAQSYNRYSYVNNNPLKYSDPSGYFKLSDVLKIVAIVVAVYFTAGAAIKALGFTKVGGAWYGGQLAGSMYKVFNSVGVVNGIIGGAAGGFAAGFAGSLLNGGSLGDAFKSGLKGGIEGAITGGMLGAVGGMKMNRFARGLAHGAIHGGMAQASGGQFRHGFLSGFVSGSTDGWVDGNVTDNAAKVAVAALLAGTASSLGGGKFANGAVSGAFSMMFNELSSKNVLAHREVEVEHGNRKYTLWAGTISNSDYTTETAMGVVLDLAAGMGSSGNEKGVILMATEIEGSLLYRFTIVEGGPTSISSADWTKATIAMKAEGGYGTGYWEVGRGHTHPNNIGVSVEDVDYAIENVYIKSRDFNEGMGKIPSKFFMLKKNGELYRVRDDIPVPDWDRRFRKIHFDSSDHQILIER